MKPITFAMRVTIGGAVMDYGCTSDGPKIVFQGDCWPKELHLFARLIHEMEKHRRGQYWVPLEEDSQ